MMVLHTWHAEIAYILQTKYYCIEMMHLHSIEIAC